MNKKNSKFTVEQEDDLEDFDIDLDDDLNDEEVEESDGFVPHTKPSNKVIVIIIAVVAIILIFFGYKFVSKTFFSKAKDIVAPVATVGEVVDESTSVVEEGNAVTDTPSANIISEPVEQTADSPKVNLSGDSKLSGSTAGANETSAEQYTEKIEAGAPNLAYDTINQNSTQPSDTKDFVKSVDGTKVPANYVVSNIDLKTDFVNYTKKRGVSSEGLELFWLEATWKDRNYTIQVPFKIFKELDDTGITVVDMEVLTLNNGSKIISYMEVREDSSELLKGDK